MQKILLAIDGSETSMKACDEAIKLAQVFDAEVVLFSVVYVQPMYVTPDGMGIAEMTKMYEKNLQYHMASCETIIKSISDKFKEANIKTTAKIIKGRPSDEIIEEANTGDYCLVILGNRGLTGIKKLLLGTVSGKVANNVNCSVYIVK